MQKILVLLTLLVFALFFQNCGGVHLSAAQPQSLAVPGPAPAPAPAPVPLPGPAPAPSLTLSKMLVAASQCPNSTNNNCRTGMASEDLVTGATTFFDLGAQASGNQPFFAKVYEQGNIIRFGVSQQFSQMISATQYNGTLYLVEYDKSTGAFKKLFEDTRAENSFSFFIYAWGDCNGDGISDWIQCSGTYSFVQTPGYYYYWNDSPLFF